jgi:MoaA/NifB/PqqE/SkfB family radical SAM enzyme
MQDAPFTINIEPTEGCNLACSFCGLQAIRNNGACADEGIHGPVSSPYRFMTVNLCHHIATQVKELQWNSRIEFTGRGEPTMNPELSGLIAVTRVQLPKSILTLTTNGSGIVKPERIADLFDSGLNTIAFDDYRHNPHRERIHKSIKEFQEQTGVLLLEYPKNPEGNPYRRFNGRRIIIIQDISETASGGNVHFLQNQAGNSFKALAKPLELRCAKPFRGFTIRWDGNVAICCDDWKGLYKVSNVAREPLIKVWNHPRFNAARQFLFAGNRAAIAPCSGCNAKTYRNGLLPDKMGKDGMFPPDEESARLVAEAQSGDQYSPKL